MKKYCILFSIVFSFLLAGDHIYGYALAKLPAEEMNCTAPSSAWIDNLTPTGFDLHWSAVVGAIDYQVEVLVNNVPVFSTVTVGTSVSVSLPLSLRAGDEVQYFISAQCLEGGYSEPVIGSFSIIITEDVVMTSPGGGGPPCDDSCPFATYATSNLSDLYPIYDCNCLREGFERCALLMAAFNINLCNSTENSFSKPSDHFYPNPFDGQLQATFEVMEAGEVNLSILDFSGKEIWSVIKNEFYSSGKITVSIDGSAWEKGIYYYVFTAGADQRIGRLVRL